MFGHALSSFLVTGKPMLFQPMSPRIADLFRREAQSKVMDIRPNLLHAQTLVSRFVKGYSDDLLKYMDVIVLETAKRIGVFSVEELAKLEALGDNVTKVVYLHEKYHGKTFKEKLVLILCVRLKEGMGHVKVSSEAAQATFGISIVKKFVGRNIEHLKCTEVSCEQDVTFKQAHDLISRRGGTETQRLLRAAKEAVEDGTADHNQEMRVLVAQMVAENLVEHSSDGGTETQRLLRAAKEAVENGTADHNQEMRVLVAQMVAENIVENLNENSKERGDESFKNRLKALKAFLKEHGSYDNMNKLDSSLYYWCVSMRSARRGSASNGMVCNEERIKALNDIKFDWNPNQTFDEKLTQVVQYKEEHKKFPPQSQGGLGTWVDTQRREKRKFDKGEKSLMTQERIDKLNKIGFVWNPGQGKGGVNENKWDENLTQVVQYKEKHKRFPPQSQGVLGTWVDKQRREKKKFDKGEKSSMTQERIDKLDEVGFVWNPGQGRKSVSICDSLLQNV